MDNSNNVYVTGISFDSAYDFDFATIKYSQMVNIKKISSAIPDKFFLSQNYPNPFNPKTIINYQLLRFSEVSLKVYDILGNELETLVKEKQNAGIYQVEFDGSNYPSGVYFYKLTSGNFTDTKKMLLIK